MNSRWARGALGTMALVLLGTAAGMAAAQRGGPVTDTRQRVTLPRAERDQILAEMRGMLESVRGILYGLANDDIPMIEQAAQASAVPASGSPELDKGLPEGFLRFRVQTHLSFQSLAAQARAGDSRDEIIRRLATITNACVGCHGAYRVVEGPALAPGAAAPTAPR